MISLVARILEILIAFLEWLLAKIEKKKAMKLTFKERKNAK